MARTRKSPQRDAAYRYYAPNLPARWRAVKTAPPANQGSDVSGPCCLRHPSSVAAMATAKNDATR